jgi:hypothetical protein
MAPLLDAKVSKKVDSNETEKACSKNIFSVSTDRLSIINTFTAHFEPKPVFNMKTFLKIVAAVLIISSTVTFTSCSKSTYGHNYHAKSRGSSSTIDPLSRKSQPVRKKYIINNKRRRILGNETPSVK